MIAVILVDARAKLTNSKYFHLPQIATRRLQRLVDRTTGLLFESRLNDDC